MLEVIKKKTVWVPLVAIFLLIIGFYLKYYKSDDMPTVIAEFVEKRDIVHKVNASETIQPEDAKIVIKMINKEKIDGLTRVVVEEAFPGLLRDSEK